MFISIHKGEGCVIIVPNPVHVVCECPQSGGRKKRTNATEAMYWKKWTDFLKSKEEVKKLLRTFSKKKNNLVT